MKTKLFLHLLSLTLGALPLLAELKYFPKDKAELLQLVKNEKIKLDEIETSKITDMSYLFCQAEWSECKNSAKKRKNFRGIEKWNTSNTENMEGMFYNNKKFNEPIGKWDVGRVKNMSYMFDEAEAFNQSLENWNVGNVVDMSYMFYGAKTFNQPLEKWDVSNVKDMESMFSNTKAFHQDLSSWGKKDPSKTSAYRFEKTFALIGVDESKATQLFLKLLNSKEKSKEQEDSKLYLAYLYLNNPNGDKQEANRLANEYVDNLLKDCTQDNNSNFCLDYAKPLEFKSVEDIFEVIYFSEGCYAYGMIPSHPSIFKYMGMYYGSNRDNFLGSFCGKVPPPYRIISIAPILEAKNYSKILEFLEAKPYSVQGSMRFGVGAETRKNELIYSFFPEFDITSSSRWDYSATEDPDYRYFGWFKMIINQYPDLLEAYNKCVKEAQEYYINVLKIERQTALEYGKRAVELLLLQELHYYTI